ncbi:hypothetical protein [Magnetofaba australis]|uniref:Uncharacterized protein n=1 Tax=Magnetofaba australis IT-1 TaxID=1434232 RepID=A0A1Y2K1X7_9PROT|nr:hypothetical protein [Magnetofaba australis]OSM01667.1 hypothetical protein MAIT1_01685 [Magnetofaba australis IT-1]
MDKLLCIDVNGVLLESEQEIELASWLEFAQWAAARHHVLQGEAMPDAGWFDRVRRFLYLFGDTPPAARWPLLAAGFDPDALSAELMAQLAAIAPEQTESAGHPHLADWPDADLWDAFVGWRTHHPIPLDPPDPQRHPRALPPTWLARWRPFYPLLTKPEHRVAINTLLLGRFDPGQLNESIINGLSHADAALERETMQRITQIRNDLLDRPDYGEMIALFPKQVDYAWLGEQHRAGVVVMITNNVFALEGLRRNGFPVTDAHVRSNAQGVSNKAEHIRALMTRDQIEPTRILFVDDKSGSLQDVADGLPQIPRENLVQPEWAPEGANDGRFPRLDFADIRACFEAL